jgi:rhodanese-related sulfurtransferase
VTGVGAEDAREAIAGGEARTGIVDCRSEEEFGEGHVAGAVRVSEEDLDGLAQRLSDEDHERWIVICEDGTRSREVAERLVRDGLDADYLEGGMKAWIKADFPVQPPPPPEFEGAKNTTLY